MRNPLRLLLALALAVCPAALRGDGSTPARLLRFPDIHGDFVVFVYGGDIWRAPVTGGPALRLTSHEGLELFPKISPDGRWIAFSAEYTGTRQVYVMPSWGGEPKQLTFYNDVGPMPPRGGWDDWVLGWTRDGKILVRMNRVPYSARIGRYYVVDPAGGLETPLELPEGGTASFSPDGKRLAYCPVSREFRTWKRTKGGMAQDVWIWDFVAKRSERITDWVGTDNFPMWAGDSIWFTSDRDGTLNIWAYDLPTKGTRKVTDFSEYDVLWPSLDANGKQIVFMNGGWLWRLDLVTGKAEKIPITLGTDGPQVVPSFRDVKDFVASASLSPSGARVVFDARGDLFSVPAREGPTRNLTDTQGIRERDPVWSPDGRWIAYLSDATGESELWMRAQDGSGEPRRLTTGGGPWKFAPVFSPDSTELAFGDRSRRLFIVDVATGKKTEVDRDSQGDLDTAVFSPDGRWLVYEKNHPDRIPGLATYSLATKAISMLGDGLTPDHGPVFSPDGKYLYFLSERDFTPTFSAFEFNYVYARATRVYAVALAPGTPSLFPPKSDEEKGKAAPAEAGKKEEPKKPEDVVIVPEGFVGRTFALPGLRPGDYRNLQAAAEAVFYLRTAQGEREPSLFRYDLKERNEEKVLDGVDAFELSADGKKLLYRAKKDWFVVDAKAGLKAGEGKLDLSGLKMKIDPKAETRQMFEDAWRIVRDFYYDPNMHGVDWDAMKRRYGALVPFVADRADLDFILGEMISELRSGHTYVESGDQPKVVRVEGGMLGCEFGADPSGRYRISKIFPGENWDEAFRSPLTEPGLNVKEGSFLLAIDGVDLKTSDNPFRLLEGKASQPVELRISETGDGKGARTLLVRPVSSEANLRYLEWVKSRMALAEKLSGGKVGYLHLPDTALSGNRMLQKLYYAESGKPALIIDERYNGGGFIPDRMIEMFSRKVLAWWAQRDVLSFRTPQFAHPGPMAMLVNGYSGSGGDALPYFFRLQRLGTIIGTRTWGGLIGLSGNPDLVDGGTVEVPTFRIYDAEGHWVVENHGVDPDIEVVDLPEARIVGHDPSLEKAVEVLMKELQKNPPKEPPRPVPPDMAHGTPEG